MPQLSEERILVDIATGRLAEMHVRVWKPASTSRGTVFCIHGYTGNGSDFNFLAELLVTLGYTVVCPDLLGRGRSAYLGDGALYTFDLFMKCMSALAPFASQNNIFIGSSWGATVTLVFLRMTSTLCSSLILNDVCLTSGRDLERMRDRISADSASVFADRDEAKAYLVSTRPYLADLDEARMSEYLDQKLIASGSKLRLAYDPTMPDGIAVQRGREFDLAPLITRMKSPTFLIYGRESPLRDPDKIAAMRAANPLVHSVDDVPAGHPPSLMNMHEALIVTGFISLSAGRVSAGPSGSSTSRVR